MAQAYLVGHGGALSPNTPGGDPVGNYLSKAIAVDNQKLQRQQSESYAKQVEAQALGQKLKHLEGVMDLAGSKSPAGRAAYAEYSGLVGIPYDPNDVDDETHTTIIDNGRKQWAKIAADKTLSDVDRQVKFEALRQAAIDAVSRAGGTKTERAAAVKAVEQDFSGREKLQTEGRRNKEHDRRAGGALGRTYAGQENADRLRREYRQDFPPAGRTAGSREGIDISATAATIRQSLEKRKYPGPDGRPTVAWEKLPAEEQDRLLLEAQQRAQRVVQGKAGVPGADPTAVGPVPGIRTDLPRPAPGPAISTGDPDEDQQVGALRDAYAEASAIQGDQKAKVKLVMQRAIEAGYDVQFNPETGDISAGKKRPGDVDRLKAALSAME